MPIKQVSNKKYVAAATGRKWNTKEEAINDNTRYKKDINYRYGVKASNYKSPLVNYNIPFIKDKAITLTNAGLATGAVLSTNLLDSIAVNAERAGLPIKTAIGLATKESTLNNPTYDIENRAKISKQERAILKRMTYRQKQTGVYYDNKPQQNINVGDTSEERLINYNPNDNPYYDSMTYAFNRAKSWEDNVRMLEESERYDDKRAIINQSKPQKSYLQAGFEFYKRNPNKYNPGQPNYPQLVDKRGEEVWGSPEVQDWYRGYRRRLESRGSRIK